jgi:hypothetical protein
MWGTFIETVIYLVLGIGALMISYNPLLQEIEQGKLKQYSLFDFFCFIGAIGGITSFIMYGIINLYRIFKGRLILDSCFTLFLPGTDTVKITLPQDIQIGRIVIYFVGSSAGYHGRIILRKREEGINTPETISKLRKMHSTRSKRVSPLVIPINFSVKAGMVITLTFELEATFPNTEVEYDGVEEIEIQVRS